MNLTKALELLAETYDLPFGEMEEAALMDNIGGYHPDPEQATFPIGSMFGAEGQVLHALTYAIKPKAVVNLGVFSGCSVLHIATALARNYDEDKRKNKAHPVLYAVDKNLEQRNLDIINHPAVINHVQWIEADATDYMENEIPSKRIDLVFEDLEHDTETTALVWKHAMAKVKKNGFVISHDAEHWLVGEAVRVGIMLSGIKEAPVMFTPAPSDCGFAIWRNE